MCCSLHLVFNSFNNEIDLYRSECKHTHPEILTKIKSRLPNASREEIQNIFCNDFRIKSKDILQSLSLNKITLPTRTQLNNYLECLRREKFSQSTIYLGKLEKLLIENSAVTEKEADAFVIG